MEKQATINESSAAPIAVAPPSPMSGGSGQATKYIAIILAVALVGGGGFFAGTQYAKTTDSAQSGMIGGMGNQNGSGFGGRMGQMGNLGTVTAISSSSITVSISQGPPDQQSSSSNSTTSKTYAITSDTTITDNGETVSASDISTGDTVMIQASSSDSSTASSIRVNPSFGGMGGGQTQSSTNSSSSTDDSSI